MSLPVPPQAYSDFTLHLLHPLGTDVRGVLEMVCVRGYGATILHIKDDPPGVRVTLRLRHDLLGTIKKVLEPHGLICRAVDIPSQSTPAYTLPLPQSPQHPAPSALQFTDEEREVFVFADDRGQRRADPLALRRRLTQASRGELQKLVELAAGPRRAPGDISEPLPLSPEETLQIEDARERLVVVIRQAFGLRDFDETTGEGCTEGMLWRVWDTYTGYLQGEKKPAGS